MSNRVFKSHLPIACPEVGYTRYTTNIEDTLDGETFRNDVWKEVDRKELETALSEGLVYQTQPGVYLPVAMDAGCGMRDVGNVEEFS